MSVQQVMGRVTVGRVYAAVIAGLIVASLGLRMWPAGSGTIESRLMDWLILLAIPGLYWLPTLIASIRRSDATWLILAWNTLAGWTGLAWIVCLIWSILPEPRAARSRPAPVPHTVTEYTGSPVAVYYITGPDRHS